MKRYPFFLALLLFHLFASVSFAQSSDKSGQDFFTAYNSGDYSLAFHLGQKWVGGLEKQKNKDDQTLIQAYGYMAYVAFMLQRYDEALHYSESSFEIHKKLFSPSDPNYLNAAYAVGSYCTYAGEQKRAIEIFKDIRDQLVPSYGKDAENFVSLRFQIIQLLISTGSEGEAADEFNNLYKDLHNREEPRDSLFFSIRDQFFEFNEQRSLFDRNVELFRDELKMAEKEKAVKLNEEYITSINLLGEYQIQSGKYADAEKTFKEMLDLCIAYYGEGSADHATALNNVGVTLEKQGKNLEAEKVYLQALEIKGKVFRKNSEYYALTLLNLGVLYDNMGKYGLALNYVEESIAILNELPDKENTTRATALSNATSLYYSLGKWDNALSSVNEALRVFKLKESVLSAGYVNSLNNRSLVYQGMGKYELAARDLDSVILIRKQLQGINYPDLAVSLMNLAHVYTFKGEYFLADSLLESSLSILENSVGKEHSSYVNCLLSKADNLTIIGNYSQAAGTFEMANGLSRKVYGEDHPEYAAFLNNWAKFQTEVNNASFAVQLLEKSMRILDQNNLSVSSASVSVNSNLSNAYLQMNHYKQAEKSILNALSISEKLNSADHPDHFTLLNNSATYYLETGNYEKAKELYEKALIGRTRIYGGQHVEVATSENNLGALFLYRASQTDKHDDRIRFAREAELHFLNAYTIDLKIYSNPHPDMASHLNNLGEAYRLLNDPEKAIMRYNEAIEIEEKIFGKSNSRTAVSLHNMSLVKGDQKNFKEAVNFAQRAASIFHEEYGRSSYQSMGVEYSLGYFLNRTGDSGKAMDYFLLAESKRKEQWRLSFSFMNDEEKDRFFSSNETYENMFLSFCLDKNKENGILSEHCANLVLNRKGALLHSSRALKQTVQNHHDPEVKSLYFYWNNLNKSLSGSTSVMDPIVRDSLMKVSGELEKKLIDRLGENGKSLFCKESTWKEIKNSLSSGEVAVDFYSVFPIDEDQPSLYFAVIISPGFDQPQLISLCSVDTLHDILKTPRGDVGTIVKSLYDDKGGKRLYTELWKEMESFIPESSTIYFSPSGELNKIAFAALSDETGRRLCEKYKLIQLNSLNDIPVSKFKRKEVTSLLLAGGIEYGNDEKWWSYLSGTLSEVGQIDSLAGVFGKKVKRLNGAIVTESNFLAEINTTRPQVLHIATHGFFWEDPANAVVSSEVVAEEVSFRSAGTGISQLAYHPDPMFRSGLVFAGANSSGGEGDDDGLLTASEVRTIDLSSVDLVVLSACETGLGDVKNAEGVFGLQRAFRLAGARSMIISLWEVPDQETGEFMSAFYANYFRSGDLESAFQKTRLAIMKEQETVAWAAFVLVQ